MSYAAIPVPADLTVITPEGDPVPVASLVTGRLLVVQLVRYFGCLPCQDWLMQLDQLAPSLSEHGVSVAAVGGSADYQARWLRDEQGVGVPLFLDPDHQFRSAVGLDKRLGLRLLDPVAQPPTRARFVRASGPSTSLATPSKLLAWSSWTGTTTSAGSTADIGSATTQPCTSSSRPFSNSR